MRHDARPPRLRGCIEVVTTGNLLRRLVGDPTLGGVSHVMIDEVHKRDIDTDFLLIFLRDLLASRPDFCVILMLATLDADSLARYFSYGVAGQCIRRHDDCTLILRIVDTTSDNDVRGTFLFPSPLDSDGDESSSATDDDQRRLRRYPRGSSNSVKRSSHR